MARIIAEISRSELGSLPAPGDAKITGLEHLASYNWLEKPKPTILVPGSPRLWSPPSVPPTLTPDSGMVYTDQNAARNPASPLEPLFRALYTQQPDFEIEHVDVVTDRNNLRKLLRFVAGSSTDTFEIRVEVAGNKTVLFTRMNNRTTEYIRSFKGFGHNFEKAYTKGDSASTGHHRIITYSFGGMRFIVRHETDGCIRDKIGPVGVTEAAAGTDELSSLLGGLSISKPAETTVYPSGMAVKADGREVEVSSTLEIKTRAASRTLDMKEVTAQLWISQTPNLAVGYHRKRIFDDIQLHDMKPSIDKWEVDNRKDLGALASLIEKIITMVKGGSVGNAVLKYAGGTTLSIVAGDGKQALPDDLYQKWQSKKDKQHDLTPEQVGLVPKQVETGLQSQSPESTSTGEAKPGVQSDDLDGQKVVGD